MLEVVVAAESASVKQSMWSLLPHTCLSLVRFPVHFDFMDLPSRVSLTSSRTSRRSPTWHCQRFPHRYGRDDV